MPGMRVLPFLIGGLSALALAGCAAQGEPPHSLAGSTWRFVTIDGSKATSPRATLEFAEDRVGANVGCNSMGGPWRIDQQRLLAGPLAQTEMYCDGPVWQDEVAVSTLLSAAPQFELEGNWLVLRSSGHSAELERIPESAAESAKR